MNRHWWTVVAAWAATAAAAVVLGLTRPAPPLTSLTLLLALAVVVGFGLQLIVADRVGFVQRLTASTCGSLVIVLVAAALSPLA